MSGNRCRIRAWRCSIRPPTFTSRHTAPKDFNLPVLEAAASGLPIICTRGGPTDDFVTDEFARRIESRKTVVPIDGQYASQLDPDVDHLIALMANVIDETAWPRQAADAGPRHVAANYTWNDAVDTLIRKLVD